MDDGNVVDQLQQLGDLHAAGALDDADFAAAKARLLHTEDPEPPPDEPTPSAAAPEEGETFGPYRLVELIGRGGMGEVYRAFDTARERVVALKRLPLGVAGDPAYQARFRSEAALAARLNEPHIIPIHDYGEIDGRLYLDMRLVEGPDLATLLARDGRLPAPRAVEIIRQVAAALDAAHASGLVHRDIKPGNILVTERAGSGPTEGIPVSREDFVYVADFGIARLVDGATSGSLTATGTTVGSLDYVAPERFGSGHGDRRVDVYALGCVLFEALTARRPFPVEGLPAIINAHLNTPPPAPSRLVPALPSGLDAVVAHAMAKDPEARYATAGELADAARAAVNGLRVPPPSAADQTWTASVGASTPTVLHVPRAVDDAEPRRGRRRWPAVAAAAVAVVAVAGAAVLVTGVLRGDAAPSAITTQPVFSPGANPFMPSVGTDQGGVAPPAGSGGTFSGATSGLYGGTLNNAACDPGAMVTFLDNHPDKAAAWAQVEDISPADIPAFVAGLTPVILRADTAVTNHGFANGAATTVRSVLQAGSAVLVDRFGVPRARCYCGNPLTPPAAITTPSYIGEQWKGFSPGAVTTVQPAPAPLTELTLVDPVTLTVFLRPIGTAGGSDRPRDPAATTTTAAPEATSEAPAAPVAPPSAVPEPPPSPAAQAPPVQAAPPPAPETAAPAPPPTTTPPPPVAHRPEISGVGMYTEGVLVYMSVRYTDADGDAEGFGFTGVNGSGWAPETHPFSSPSYGRVSEGRVDYPFNLACGQPNQYTTDVQTWIYDSTGLKSSPTVVHLTCS